MSSDDEPPAKRMKSENPSSPGLPSLRSLLASPASPSAGGRPPQNDAPSIYESYPPISQQEMNVMARPDTLIDNIWTQGKEDELQQWWNGTRTKAAINELRGTVPSKGFMTNHSLWWASARIFKKSPLELMRSWRLVYDADIQAAALPSEGTSPEGPVIMSIAFSRHLTGAFCHPLLLALGPTVASRAIKAALQFAVLCRTDDRTGTWAFPDRSELECPVVAALAEEVGTSLGGAESIHERHERIRHGLDAEPSILSNLLHEIGRRCRRSGEDESTVCRKSHQGMAMFYVKTADVKILCDALEVVYPEGGGCDDALKKFREAHADAPWSSQLPTRDGFYGLLEKGVLDGERFWRRRELENRPPAPPAVSLGARPRARRPHPEPWFWPTSSEDSEDFPHPDDDPPRMVVSRLTGIRRVSRMSDIPDSPPG